jgi:hypothetical protein
MDKVEIVDKRVEMNFIIFTGLYYPDEKDTLTKIKFEQRSAADFLMTEDGQKDLMNKLLEAGRNKWNINQIATDKAGAYDLPVSFTPTDTIKTPVEQTPTAEDIFNNAVMGLEQKKRYLDLGLITQAEYDAELAKVKLLMPKPSIEK